MAEQMMQHIADELAVKQAIPAGYKQTEVGIIPNDWGVKCLGELVEISSGESPSKFTFNLSGIPYFKVEQLNNGLVYAESTPYFIDSRKKITSGSLIFPKRGASILLNKIRVLKYDSYMDTNLMTLTCSSELNEFYLYNQLIYKELSSVADTTSIPQINNKHIVPYTIPYPAKAEQIAIATVLSDSDALIVGLEQLIAKKQAIKTAAMQQLLTGRTRLPAFAQRPDGTPKGYKTSELGEIPEDWDAVEMAKIGSFGRGRVISHTEINKSYAKLYPVYSSQTSNDGAMGYLDSFDFDGEFVTWTTDGVNAGKVFYRNGKFNCTNVCGVIKIKDACARYVAIAMDQEARKYVSTNLANPKLMNGVAKQVLISFPNDIEEQTAIATILSDMDSELTALEQKLAKARDLKQGMMQQLLTGRIRLPLEVGV
ncbi:restriction endonuclease subunit S [Aeromonas caviae]|uniref:restriction endonuclease subunit S n=1 Tax=Aeromonas caviae TaxID=648 RepID=UPI001BD3EFBD|nr:restriction endonuclease subunit S [Aeromonas caviae]MBS4721943.1 restriction endonuclease subunit S [Aeromonas caviae]